MATAELRQEVEDRGSSFSRGVTGWVDRFRQKSIDFGNGLAANGIEESTEAPKSKLVKEFELICSNLYSGNEKQIKQGFLAYVELRDKYDFGDDIRELVTLDDVYSSIDKSWKFVKAFEDRKEQVVQRNISKYSESVDKDIKGRRKNISRLITLTKLVWNEGWVTARDIASEKFLTYTDAMLNTDSQELGRAVSRLRTKIQTIYHPDNPNNTKATNLVKKAERIANLSEEF